MLTYLKSALMGAVVCFAGTAIGTIAGCAGPSPPRPMTAEQHRAAMARYEADMRDFNHMRCGRDDCPPTPIYLPPMMPVGMTMTPPLVPGIDGPTYTFNY